MNFDGTSKSTSKLVVPLAALLVIPIAPMLAYWFEVKAPWVFLAGAIAIGVLADWVRRSTEHLAARVGPAIGGLLNVSFEFFVHRHDLYRREDLPKRLT